MLILKIGITPNGDVTAISAESTVLSQLWKKVVSNVFYAKVTGRNAHHRNPKTFNCVTITLYELSLPKEVREKPLEVKVYFEDGVPVPHKVELGLSGYKTNAPIEDLVKAICRADELYGDCGGGVSYKYPFSKIPDLQEDLRRQLNIAVVPLQQEA